MTLDKTWEQKPEVDYSWYKFHKIEIDEDGVALVTFNRPEKLNAFNWDGHYELHQTLFLDLKRDERIKVIVLTGAGRAFTAGADVAQQGDRRQRRAAGQREGYAQDFLEVMLTMDKIIIAAVNGHAVGLGATVALFSDIVIAADTAKFSDKHISVGLVPGDGGTIIWPLLIGHARAMEYLITGDIMDAQTADKFGLVNKVVPLDELMPTAMALAKRLAKGPTYAIGLTKRSIAQRILRECNLLRPSVSAYEMATFRTEDNLEGARAFVEKREPHFKGR